MPDACAPRGMDSTHPVLARAGDRRGALLVQLHPAQERDDARLDYSAARYRRR